MPFVTSVLVTTSKAPVTTSVAPVTSSVALVTSKARSPVRSVLLLLAVLARLRPVFGLPTQGPSGCYLTKELRALQGQCDGCETDMKLCHLDFLFASPHLVYNLYTSTVCDSICISPLHFFSVFCLSRVYFFWFQSFYTCCCFAICIIPAVAAWFVCCRFSALLCAFLCHFALPYLFENAS